MKRFKSHFKFTKEQRNGIFLLVLLILVFQFVYFYTLNKAPSSNFDNPELELYQKEIDSLKQVKLEDSKPKIYPFNPNFITDYKGYTLGMSNEEIDRLLNFRSQDKWINSTEEFQKVTGVSDSLLKEISPYFKFPEWVTNPKPRNNYNYSQGPKTYEQKIDLNSATASQLKRINGIGDALSKRIVDYRAKLKNGFAADVQLQEVYGLSPEVIERITDQFTVKTAAQISKINLNEATRDDLVSIKYIDYEIAFNIIEYRTLHENFKSLEELKSVKDFPSSKFDLIKLYLHL